MTDLSLLSTLRELESRLHRPEVRSNAAELSTLLHPDFTEVGASGRVYSREEVLAEFRDAPPGYAVWAQDFVIHAVSEGVALLLYRSAHLGVGGVLSRYVARTSLWQYDQGRWQQRYHQGTPTGPFERRES